MSHVLERKTPSSLSSMSIKLWSNRWNFDDILETYSVMSYGFLQNDHIHSPLPASTCRQSFCGATYRIKMMKHSTRKMSLSMMKRTVMKRSIRRNGHINPHLPANTCREPFCGAICRITRRGRCQFGKWEHWGSRGRLGRYQFHWWREWWWSNREERCETPWWKEWQWRGRLRRCQFRWWKEDDADKAVDFELTYLHLISFFKSGDGKDDDARAADMKDAESDDEMNDDAGALESKM